MAQNAGVLIVQAAVRICPKRHSSLSTTNLESLVMICVTSTDLKSEECRCSAVVQKVGDSRIYPVTLLPYKNYSKSKHMQLGSRFVAQLLSDDPHAEISYRKFPSR